MNISPKILQIANVQIDVVRKNIKNMHLAVYPPHGRIRLAVPENTDEEVLRLFAISKLGWIKKHVKNFKEQARETKRDYVSGESHFFQGKRYILEVNEDKGYSKVSVNGKPHKPFIDSKKDLASTSWNHFKHHPWILPSKAP